MYSMCVNELYRFTTIKYAERIKQSKRGKLLEKKNPRRNGKYVKLLIEENLMLSMLHVWLPVKQVQPCTDFYGSKRSSIIRNNLVTLVLVFTHAYVRCKKINSLTNVCIANIFEAFILFYVSSKLIFSPHVFDYVLIV